MSFTHLHLHTEYSLLDGACRIPKLVERIKALGMTSCAITDHGVMYGCIDFYSAMKDAGIKPIIGCEVYVCRDRLDKSAANREYSHLILLCENNTGYQNLMKLVSEGFLTGYYYRPRIDYNLIRQHSEGLICLSACLSGDLPKLLLLYVKSEDEMRTLFAACPDAVDRTQEIADRCNVEFEFGVTRLPHYPVPEGETALSMLCLLYTSDAADE